MMTVCLIFRVITANFFGIREFRNYREIEVNFANIAFIQNGQKQECLIFYLCFETVQEGK